MCKIAGFAFRLIPELIDLKALKNEMQLMKKTLMLPLLSLDDVKTIAVSLLPALKIISQRMRIYKMAFEPRFLSSKLDLAPM